MDIGDFIIVVHKWEIELKVTQTNGLVPAQQQVQQNSEMMSVSLHQSQLMTFCYTEEIIFNGRMNSCIVTWLNRKSLTVAQQCIFYKVMKCQQYKI